jgi:septal ring factor EnvC (AmiA/AmiB activator)
MRNKNVENDLRSLNQKLKRALQNQENRRARQLTRLIDEVQRQEATDPFMVRR